MTSVYHDLLAGFTFLVAVSIISFAYIFSGTKNNEKRKGSEIAEEDVVERNPVEERTRLSTATPEGGSFGFDVFISFRGKDTRNGFTSHMHKEFKYRGINAFIDSEDLIKGKKISDLFKHIDGSKIFVPVFSKNYAESKWCLREIAKMVEINKREGGKRPIIPVFYDVDPSDVKHSSAVSFEEAFRQHQHNIRLNKEQINEWKAALTEVGNISGFCLSEAQGNEAKLITLICKQVSGMLSNVPFDIKPIGLDFHTDTVMQMLEREKDGVCVIGICGLGGIGKTTTAMALYNKLSPTFECSCFLSDIRENEKMKGLTSLQEELLKKMLITGLKISNVTEGVSLIKRRLGGKKLLLILDDVDHRRQLEAFIANRQHKEVWFGAGSKIIVTTRDKQLLTGHGLLEEEIYFPKGLDLDHSLQLFCRHAFCKDQPLAEFDDLSQEVVEVAQGLPLALIVFGSLFYDGKKKEEWKEMLQKLKSEQNKEVHERLKISYDSLDGCEKNVFLDIACFLIGKNKEYPIYMWEACGYFPKNTLKVLQHKSLIKINKYDDFEMHDQIRDMGRMIVKEESNFDRLKYSRPWSDEHVLEVLRDAEVSNGNSHIQGLTKLPIQVSWNAVAAMPNLRMITGAGKQGFKDDEEEIIRLPCNIRWFYWDACRYGTLTFQDNGHQKLCVLDLSGGYFRNFGSHSMVFPKLKVLNLSWCSNLIRTPDFTHLPSLEVLKLPYCEKLIEIDESIKHLQKLVTLNIHRCRNLKRLPAELCKLTSLESLDLSYCQEIWCLPEQMGFLSSLHLKLSGTSISCTPHSFGRLQSREIL